MDVKKLKQLYDSGMNAEKIAKEMNYSISYIRLCLPKYGISHGRRTAVDVKNKELKKYCLANNHSPIRLAKIIGCSEQKAAHFMYGDREVRLSVNQFQRLLADMGKTFEEVFGT